MDNITFDLKEDCGSVYKTASDDPDLEETPIKQNLFEFDPLLSDKKVNDWMISFESPKPNPVAPALESSNLIDVDLNQEFNLLSLQLHQSQKHQADLIQANSEMEKTLFEWENAMQRMVTDRENDRIEHARSIEFLKEKIEKANTERDLVKKEAEAVLLKYKQARIDNQDLVESETLLKAKTSQLEQDLASSLQKFNALKTHAQDKLAEANSEIHKVRTTLESKLAATITKLDRANIAVSTLEAGLASKTAENLELTRICDGLVMQIEGMSN